MDFASNAYQKFSGKIKRNPTTLEIVGASSVVANAELHVVTFDNMKKGQLNELLTDVEVQGIEQAATDSQIMAECAKRLKTDGKITEKTTETEFLNLYGDL